MNFIFTKQCFTIFAAKTNLFPAILPAFVFIFRSIHKYQFHIHSAINFSAKKFYSHFSGQPVPLYDPYHYAIASHQTTTTTQVMLFFSQVMTSNNLNRQVSLDYIYFRLRILHFPVFLLAYIYFSANYVVLFYVPSSIEVSSMNFSVLCVCSFVKHATHSLHQCLLQHIANNFPRNYTRIRRYFELLVLSRHSNLRTAKTLFLSISF